jgi:hypothetical protein
LVDDCDLRGGSAVGTVEGTARQQRSPQRGEVSRAPGQSPEAVTQVLNKSFDRIDASHIPALLFDLLDAAQLTQRSVSSLLRRHSARDLLFDLAFKMEAQLVAQIVLDAIALEQRSKPQPNCVEEAHGQN